VLEVSSATLDCELGIEPPDGSNQRLQEAARPLREVPMKNRDGGGGAGSPASEWPERLRRGVRSVLKNCGISHSEWVTRGFDVHHIVAAGLDGAAPGRTLLSHWAISVHSVANAAIIPRAFHQGQGLHRLRFLQTVNQRLASADMFAEALSQHGGVAAGRLIMIQTIQKIGNELVLQSGDVVAIRLQAALQGRVTRSPGSGGSGGSLRPDRAGNLPVRHARKQGLTSQGVASQGIASGEGANRGDAPFFDTQRFGFHFAPSCP